MKWTSADILSILDRCCDDFTFPMLDNGYLYLAATRLTLYRSATDWAMVIEVFGYSPRAGIPDTQVCTFGSRLLRSRSASDFVSVEAHEAYLANHPNDESVFVHPIDEADWQDTDDEELVAGDATTVLVRGEPLQVPGLSAYAAHGIALEAEGQAHVFELCRLLAASARDLVLATPEERRTCVPAELSQVLQLEEWHHPDLANGERPGSSPTFVALAEGLVSGDLSNWCATDSPNTHWKHWPEGGAL